MPLELKQRPNGIWYVSGSVVVWKGGRSHTVEVRRSTKTADYRQAEAIKRQIENEVAERNITGREPAITFKEAAARYVRQGGEERFLSKPLARLGAYRIDEITQQVLDDEGFAAYPGNDATRRRQFYAPTIAVLRGNGIEKIFKRPADNKKRTIFFRPEQAVTLVEHIKDSRWPNYWSPALATFLFGQGCRVSEALGIDGRDDISLDNKYVILRDTKNGEERMVPLCARVIAAITPIPNLGRKGPLFLRYDGRPYSERDGRGYRLDFWRRAVTAMDLAINDYTPHAARHSWATWHYSQNKDVVRLKSEGGWLSNEWERYVKLANKSLGDAAIAAGYDFREDSGTNKERGGEKFAGFLRA